MTRCCLPWLTARALAGVVMVVPLAARGDDSAPDLQQLVGATVDVRLAAGKSFGDAKVEKVRPGAAAGSIVSLTITPADSPRQQTLGVQLIEEIARDGTPLDVSYDKRSRELRHDPQKRAQRLQREAAIVERMKAKRARYWKEIEPDSLEQYTAEEKEFLAKAAQTMNRPMQLLETRYFLFSTDMPLPTVGVYVKYLDTMYETLTTAFGVPHGKNIWRGKCSIIAFQNRFDFERFEREVMENSDVQGAQGLCHSSSTGRVRISAYKGSSEAFFGTLLVHETAHGFIHRYKSTVHVPPWINEGIAEWVAGKVIGKLDDNVPWRQRQAVEVLRRTGSLGASFFDPAARLEAWQYGAASSLVDVLLRIDAKQYRRLIDNIKEGMESEEALRDAYGFGFAELSQRYGALIRVPGLRPL